MMTTNKSIAVYILAGGKSQRMGTDKGLLSLDNKPIVLHIYNTLKSISDSITIISANDKYDFLGCPRIEDKIEDKGPVGGIYTALAHTKSELNLILSVDVPMVKPELLQWIIDNHHSDFQMTQVSINGKASPLVAIYDKRLKSIFEENTKSDLLKLRSIIENINCQTLEIPEKWQFQIQNINTPEDYQNIVKS